MLYKNDCLRYRTEVKEQFPYSRGDRNLKKKIKAILYLKKKIENLTHLKILIPDILSWIEEIKI